MSLYVSIVGEVRELPDELVAAWAAANNPKADYWRLLPPCPGEGWTLNTTTFTWVEQA